jgi:hypothetical protein
MSEQELLIQLSRVLPGVVDKFTPTAVFRMRMPFDDAGRVGSESAANMSTHAVTAPPHTTAGTQPSWPVRHLPASRPSPSVSCRRLSDASLRSWVAAKVGQVATGLSRPEGGRARRESAVRYCAADFGQRAE